MVFKWKYNANGLIQRYKAWLVAKEFHQSERHYFTNTFSSVIKPPTIRLVLTIVLSSRWPIHQIDINNTFLHGDRDSPVHMQQPPGFMNFDTSLVCRLNKAIYGLKQAPCSGFRNPPTLFFKSGSPILKLLSLFLLDSLLLILFLS